LWLIDGNNVYGSRPDGWWNNRTRAASRLTEAVARWCVTHDGDVVLVFDPPVASETMILAGGNLEVVEAPRRGRDAADDELVRRAELALSTEPELEGEQLVVRVVTSDKGLKRRLDPRVQTASVGEFRRLVDY